MLPVQILKLTATVSCRQMAVRSMAASATQLDPIQKLFLDKIKEYSTKSKSAPNGLVDSNPELMKRLKEEMDRVANAYGIKNESDLANLGLKFEETFKLDPINLK